MPITITIKYAKLPHGLVAFYQHWIPERPRALMVFIHDLGDHIGRYGAFVQAAAGRGVASALVDSRGHGQSRGRRGHVKRFSDWVNDLDSFVQFSQMAVPEGTPLYLVGVGLGALVGVHFLLTHAVPVDGMVALSPSITPMAALASWRRTLVQRAARWFPRMGMASGVRIEDLTSDESERVALAADSLFHRRITLAAAQEIERHLEMVMAMPHRIALPMLVLAGSADRIFDPEGARQFASRLSSADRRCVIYPGMRHDLLHDVGREEVQEEIIGWIERQSRARPRAAQQLALRRRERLWEDASLPLP